MTKRGKRDERNKKDLEFSKHSRSGQMVFPLSMYVLQGVDKTIGKLYFIEFFLPEFNKMARNNYINRSH